MGRGPIFTWRGALMTLVAYLLLSFLFLSLSRAVSYFGFILVAFGCTAYLASTITNYLTAGRNSLIQPIVNSSILIILLTIYGLWLLNISFPLKGIISGIGLVLMVQFGAYFIDQHRRFALERFSKGKVIRISQNLIHSIESLFVNQSQVYIAIPLGVIIGIAIGTKLGLSSDEIAFIVLQSIFTLLSISLFFLLSINFIKLSKPLIDFDKVNQPIARARAATKSKLLAELTKSLIVFKAPKVKSDEDAGKMEQDIACAVSDIRKIYLYNSLHNATILFVLILMNLSLFKININSAWIAGSFFLTLIIFTQLPYIMGQSAMHEKVTQEYEGVSREKIKEDLRKYAPLFPTYHSIVALTASGTAGGVMYYLLDNLIKGLFPK